jgi:quinol monooxygenase YgiN
MSQVTNLAFFRARRGQSAALGAALASQVESTRLEAGCLNFVIHPATLTFSTYIFLTKRAGFAPSLLPTI